MSFSVSLAMCAQVSETRARGFRAPCRKKSHVAGTCRALTARPPSQAADEAAAAARLAAVLLQDDLAQLDRRRPLERADALAVVRTVVLDALRAPVADDERLALEAR